ncbi:hypothetical protein ACFW9D_05780 [Streptomyces sp. NPDC059524]|uniref:hypothetical protein n=1 Tax=Streptomyces sp. NPDC059524 TaxID=3346856 RepID=UPI0036923D35
MGTTDSTAQQASAQLAHLARYFVELPTTGHTGGPTAPVRSIENTAPLNVDTVSHIADSVREIRDYMTRESPGTLEPLPAEAAAVYDWCLRNTEHDDRAARQRRDTIIYRQYLEHAILTGDKLVVRRHRCPGCGTVGLHWHSGLKAAVCRNRRCTSDGRASTWSLAFLAHEHIQEQERLSVRAT